MRAQKRIESREKRERDARRADAKEVREAARKQRAAWYSMRGDVHTMVRAVVAAQEAYASGGSAAVSKFCNERGISEKSLAEVQRMRTQLT